MAKKNAQTKGVCNQGESTEFNLAHQ